MTAKPAAADQEIHTKVQTADMQSIHGAAEWLRCMMDNSDNMQTSSMSSGHLYKAARDISVSRWEIFTCLLQVNVLADFYVTILAQMKFI